MQIMKDLTKKIRSKGRMDAKSRWWFPELLVADCEKAWIHTGWEDTMQKWYNWLEEVKKKDEREKWRKTSTQGGANDQECGRKCGPLAQNLQAYSMEGERAQILENEEEDARLLDR